MNPSHQEPRSDKISRTKYSLPPKEIFKKGERHPLRLGMKYRWPQFHPNLTKNKTSFRAETRIALNPYPMLQWKSGGPRFARTSINCLFRHYFAAYYWLLQTELLLPIPAKMCLQINRLAIYHAHSLCSRPFQIFLMWHIIKQWGNSCFQHLITFLRTWGKGHLRTCMMVQ